jgi:hypothetical protein
MAWRGMSYVDEVPLPLVPGGSSATGEGEIFFGSLIPPRCPVRVPSPLGRADTLSAWTRTAHGHPPNIGRCFVDLPRYVRSAALQAEETGGTKKSVKHVKDSPHPFELNARLLEQIFSTSTQCGLTELNNAGVRFP